MITLMIFTGVMISVGVEDARAMKSSVSTVDNKSTEPAKTTRPIKKIIPVIEFNAGNLSDSILNSHGLLYNAKRGVYIGREKKCGLGGNFFNGGIAHENMALPHTFTLGWFHKLSGNTYTATINLDIKMVDWAFNTYLPSKLNYVKTENSPSITILYRTRNRVEAWLVILGDTKEKTAFKIGEAIGKIVSHSAQAFPSYLSMAGRTRGFYRIGDDLQYNREFDQTLSAQERFGCYHDKYDIPLNENYPIRYPVLVGLKGEYIQCTEWECKDHSTLIKKWKMKIKNLSQTYSVENPRGLRNFRKLPPRKYEVWVAREIAGRKRTLKRREKIWVCLIFGKPCFKGIHKDYGYNNRTPSQK